MIEAAHLRAEVRSYRGQPKESEQVRLKRATYMGVRAVARASLTKP